MSSIFPEYKFKQIVDGQMNRTYEALERKRKRTTVGDDAHYTIKMAAMLQDVNPFEALAGSMAEPVAELFAMLRSNRWPSRSEWEETVTAIMTDLARIMPLVDEMQTPPEEQPPPATGSIDTTMIRGVAGESFPLTHDTSTTTPEKGIHV